MDLYKFVYLFLWTGDVGQMNIHAGSNGGAIYADAMKAIYERQLIVG